TRLSDAWIILTLESPAKYSLVSTANPSPAQLVRLSDRGVYRLPWIGPNDVRYLAVVGYGGRALFRVVVLDLESIRDVEILVWRVLESVDPADRPSLRIVR